MEQSRELGNIPLFIGSFDFLAPPLGMWDLSSPTRNQTILPTSGAQSLNHWMAWEVPGSFQFSPVPQSCPTLCDPMNCSMPGFPVHHQLLELTQNHVHWVGNAIQPSHPLSSPSPTAFNHSEHQGLFKWVNSSHKVAKVLEFQLQHQSFRWVFRVDFL